MSSIIEINNFTKRYDSFLAVDDINLVVKKGSIFGLLGPNGAGKTTTIKAMTGRLNLTGGSVKVLGHDVKQEMKSIHQKIGVVSEGQNLYEHLTVFENINFFRELYHLDKEKSLEIIEVLSLCEKKDVKVSKLSKGLKQRVLLGRSILHSPDLLFLDEPTSGLDPQSSHNVLEFIKTIRDRGTTVFLTTHYMEEADFLCDEVAFINHGKIVANDTPKSLKSRFGNNEIEVTYVDNKTEKNAIYSLEEDKVFLKIEEIHKDHKILSLHSKEATMKDVFLNLIGHKGAQA